MSTLAMMDHDYTAIPQGTHGRPDLSVYGGYDLGLPADGPRDPLPWSEETNNLYVRLVQCSWEDLLRPDRPRVSLARDALMWFEAGAPVALGDERGSTVSLFEVWEWPASRVVTAARSRFANRASLRLASARGRSARFELPENHSVSGRDWINELARELLPQSADAVVGEPPAERVVCTAGFPVPEE